MLNISGQHLATPLIEMNPLSSEEGSTTPERVKIINKIHVVRSACGLEPGVQAENATKTISSATKCGNWARDKNRHYTVF